MAKAFRSLNSPVLGFTSQVTFGRYIGLTVEEVLKTRPEYVAWLLDNTDIKFTEQVVSLVDTLLPPVPVSFTLVPKDVSYWQTHDHWHDDIPF